MRVSIVDEVKAAVAEYEPAVRAKLADVVERVKGWSDGELDELVTHLRGTADATAEPEPPADGAGDPAVPDPAAVTDGTADAGEPPAVSEPADAPAAAETADTPAVAETATPSA